MNSQEQQLEQQLGEDAHAGKDLNVTGSNCKRM